MEEQVVIAEPDSYDAVLAWWSLVATWSVLRFGGHVGIFPGEGGWEFLVNLSKTTGHDRKVSCRFGIISSQAYIKDPEWMRIGS